MINEVSVSYRSRTFCYVEYCIRITVTTFIFTFFWKNNNSLWQKFFYLFIFFSFIAIDEQTTACHSICLWGSSCRYNSVLSKKEYTYLSF